MDQFSAARSAEISIAESAVHKDDCGGVFGDGCARSLDGNPKIPVHKQGMFRKVTFAKDCY
jgi:hypothetical protein